MKTYRIIDIIASFGIFLDDEIEAENDLEAKEQIFDEIYDNLANYIDIELEELDEGE